MRAAATSTKQTIHQDPQEPSHFSMIPHLAADTLNPYQLALYTHYKRVAGENGGVCLEGVRTTAKKTQMSIGKVTQTRDELSEKGWIRVKVPDIKNHPKATVIIKLVNRWEENRAYCESLRKDKRSQDEQPTDTTVHDTNTTVHHMNTSQEGSVHHMNERITINTKEETLPPNPRTSDHETPEPAESKAATERGGGDAADTGKGKSVKRQKERKSTTLKAEVRGKLFEVVCIGSFGKQYQNINGSKGFAAKIVQQIHEKSPSITPEQLEAGYRYFSGKFPDVLKDNDKRLKDTDKILHYVELAAVEKAAHPTYGDPDPNCDDCNGKGFWIDKSDQYNHKRVMCGCRVPEGMTNG